MSHDTERSAELAVTFLLGERDPALSRGWSDEDRMQLVKKVEREILARVPEAIRDSWTAARLGVPPDALATPEARAALARRMLAKLDEEVEGHSIAITLEDGCSYVYTDNARYCSYTFGLTLTERGGRPTRWEVRHRPEGKPEQVLPLRLCVSWQAQLSQAELRPQPTRKLPSQPPPPDRERSR